MKVIFKRKGACVSIECQGTLPVDEFVLFLTDKNKVTKRPFCDEVGDVIKEQIDIYIDPRYNLCPLTGENTVRSFYLGKSGMNPFHMHYTTVAEAKEAMKIMVECVKEAIRRKKGNEI